jgi:dTMP kinase
VFGTPDTMSTASGSVGSCFIVFEGGEATGKSTQAARLATDLDAVLTREPGGTEIGSRIRTLFLDPRSSGMSPRTESLLMAADRAQHAAEVVGPALAAARHVVSDRSAYSSLAYQGFGRQLPLEEVRALSEWAMTGRWPDLVILLDVTPAEAAVRLDRALDRLEQQDAAFHERVAEGFRVLAAAEPERWVVVDGTGSVDEVARAVGAAVRARLGLGSATDPASTLGA